MSTTSTVADILPRLIAIDAALASPAGLHLGDMAAEFGVSTKTIRRDLQSLSSVGCETFTREVATEANSVGRTWRHWYADRRRRLFACWLTAD